VLPPVRGRLANGPDPVEIDRPRTLKRDCVPQPTVIGIDKLDAVGQFAGLDRQMEVTIRSIRVIGWHASMMLDGGSKSRATR
jgi:hypothetical protein